MNRALALGLIAAASAILAGASCRGQDGASPITVTGTGAAINDRADVEPAKAPGKEAMLVFPGLETPVEVHTRTSGTLYTIELHAHGEVFEEESYEDLPQQFAVRSAAGERYDPAVPLLKFPMRIGDKWDWKGRMFTADQSRGATATIETSEVTVQELPDAPKAIQVEVEFRIDNGTPEPAQRRLTFSFVPKMGLIKRDFGTASSRVPAVEASVTGE